VSSDDIHAPIGAKAPQGTKTIGAVIAAAFLGLAVGGLTGRYKDEKALALSDQQRAVQSVALIRIEAPHEAEPLVLPGTLEAFNSALVYARVSGYVKRWVLDIGEPVRAGQLLAEIETPDLDEQLAQAQANLATARANEKLSEITARRWQSQLENDSVSRQEVDEKTGDFAAKKTIVDAAQANVKRLLAMQSFRRITAPFDGLVTARNTDIGALINAGEQSGHELFRVADIHRLRLYVSVPQAYADRIQAGSAVQFSVPEHPGQSFRAKYVGNARSVNESSGTVLIQMDVDNRQRLLLPGSYANVTFNLAASQNSLQIPASALMLRKQGPQVAVLGANERVAFRRVDVVRDLGPTVQISGAVKPGDQLIDNPSDMLADGDVVRVSRPEAKRP